VAAWCCLVLRAELQPEVASEIDLKKISSYYTLKNASAIEANQAYDARE
jgi:hypothetical protein